MHCDKHSLFCRTSPEDMFLELVLKDPLGKSAEDFTEMIRIDTRPLLKEAALKLLHEGHETDLVQSYFTKSRVTYFCNLT